jgi:hypothetical protein
MTPGMIEARRWSLAEHKRAEFLVYYNIAEVQRAIHP